MAGPRGESFTHDTFWHLEKRNGGIDEFCLDRSGEAHAILSGSRPHNLLTGKHADRFMEQYQKFQSKHGASWTTDRLISESLKVLFHAEVAPYEVVEREGNILVTAGIDLMLDLLIGAGGTNFANANAYLGVGDSSTAAAVGQTDLQAASNKTRKAMNGSYPAVTSPAIDFQSTFGSGDANYAWAEIATFNASTSGTMLNRVVQSLGTKASGSSWSLTETITFT